MSGFQESICIGEKKFDLLDSGIFTTQVDRFSLYLKNVICYNPLNYSQVWVTVMFDVWDLS